MLLRLSNESAELIDLQERLTIYLLARQGVKALLKPVESVSLGACLLHQIAQLTFQLNLEDARIHKELHCI